MDLGKMVDVAIGLSMMYLVLSLFCTIINEYIAGFTKQRSKTLKDGLMRLAGGSSEFLALLAHPSIRSAALDVKELKTPLNKAKAAETNAQAGLDKAKATLKATPADDALKAAVAKAEATLAQVKGVAQRLEQAATGATSHEHSYLSGQAFAAAVLDTLNPSVQTSSAETYKAVMTAVDALPSGHCKEVLRSTLNNASADLQSARDALAQWFDGQMEQVQGAYKRYVQIVSVCVGLLLAVFLNADSLSVAKALWQDRSLGTQVADGAANLLSSKGAIIGGVTESEATLATATDTVNKALAAKAAADAALKAATDTDKDARAKAAAEAASALQTAQTAQTNAEQKRLVAVEAAKSSAKSFRDALAPLPLGWPGSAWYCRVFGVDGKSCTAEPGILALFAQILGLALTALALGLGAPFWFDILSKAVNIRSAGSRPQATTLVAAPAQLLQERPVGQTGGTGG